MSGSIRVTFLNDRVFIEKSRAEQLASFELTKAQAKSLARVIIAKWGDVK